MLHLKLLNEQLEQAIERAVERAFEKNIAKLYTKSVTKEYLSKKEIKRLLFVSDSTLHRLRRQGLIPFTVVGGNIIYPRKGIELYLQKATVNAKFTGI